DAVVGDLLFAVWRHRPEMLRSRRQMTYEDILDHDSLESLIDALAEATLADLAYKSTREQYKALNERFGLAVPAQDVLAELELIREKRNLLVHRNGVVDRRSAARYPDIAPAGSALVISEADVTATDQTTSILARHLLADLVAKFCPGVELAQVVPWA